MWITLEDMDLFYLCKFQLFMQDFKEPHGCQLLSFGKNCAISTDQIEPIVVCNPKRDRALDIVSPALPATGQWDYSTPRYRFQKIKIDVVKINFIVLPKIINLAENRGSFRNSSSDHNNSIHRGPVRALCSTSWLKSYVLSTTLAIALKLRKRDCLCHAGNINSSAKANKPGAQTICQRDAR